LDAAIASGVVATWDGSAPFNGSGNDVVTYSGGAGILDYSNAGDSNFFVIAYGANGGDLLINDIGPVQGSSRMTPGPTILDIQAQGDWTLTVRPV
jgi:hypothetical protein